MDSNASLPFVLYEDDRCFVLDKPSGLHSVELASNANESLASLLLRVMPALAHVAEKKGDAGLVQRLDFETSGVILGARDRAAWNFLRAQLSEGHIEKEYLIVTEGEFPERAEVDNFIGSPYRRSKKVRVHATRPGREARALPASTAFERCSYSASSQFSLVRAQASTARRHQVRAHAAFLGHPLVGDELYGSTRSLQEVLRAACTQNSPRFFLRASLIQFLSPSSGEIVRIEAALPDYLKLS